MHIEKDSQPEKILLVRNDNIGDLICSIPSIQFLREQLPQAKIHLLVNSYNAPIAVPLVPKHVDRLVIYRKTKHAGLSLSQLTYLFKFYAELKREHYDTVLLLVGGPSRQSHSFAKWTGARQILGYGPGDEGPEFKAGFHELEYSWKLANHLCGTTTPPPREIRYPIRATGSRTAIQITSRKTGNRWRASQFAELAERIFEKNGSKPLLLWSPGDAKTLTHPGDDAKAAEILGLKPEFIEPRPTATLEELIDALKECRCLITPDGGAMHLAAAMGLSIVAMFGQSDPVRWRPWTPHAQVLQSLSRSIQDIEVDEVMNAHSRILPVTTAFP